MLGRKLAWTAVAACLHAGQLAAQPRVEFGPLLPAGEAATSVPASDAYAREAMPSPPAGTAKLPAALDKLSRPEPALKLRGAREIALYRTLAPSVAGIVTDDAEGSASLIAVRSSPSGAKTGVLLTNAHVVGDAPEVSVYFKPQREGDKITAAQAIPGRVRKVDPVRDLALVEVQSVPAHAVVIPLGAMDEVQIGADVHAIGHPEGQVWTYTKGLISQIRRGYQWLSHKADVIQTQTPISPGSSGGPLISDSGKLIGVNAFKAPGEALNFAVAVDEVEAFLRAPDSAYEPKAASAAAKPCKPRVMYEGRSKDNVASIHNLDMDCSGKVNATVYIPDDLSQPIVFRLDTNNDGRSDAWIVDENRDGKWDISYWDTDFDGKPDLVGHHPDGALKPARVEKYTPKN